MTNFNEFDLSLQVYSRNALKAKFDMSLLRRLYKHDRQNSCGFSLLLDKNYRSCQAILNFVKIFYGLRLVSEYDGQEHPNLYPLNFVSVRGSDEMVGMSYINKEEAVEIVDKVESLLAHWPEDLWGRKNASDIVVLSPYHMQVAIQVFVTLGFLYSTM